MQASIQEKKDSEVHNKCPCYCGQFILEKNSENFVVWNSAAKKADILVALVEVHNLTPTTGDICLKGTGCPILH